MGLHLKEDGAEGEGQTAKHVKPDDNASTDNKMETGDTKSDKKVEEGLKKTPEDKGISKNSGGTGAKEVEEGVKKTTTEDKGTSKNMKAKRNKSQQNKHKKQNKNKEKQRMQSIRDKKKHEEKKAKELENKHSKEFALVDSLVFNMEKTSKFKQKQVKRKLDAIEAMMNHKYEKKRGKTKKTAEIKKL